MVSIVDKFLDRSWDKRNYNCLHFTRDVWLELTGQDIQERMASAYATQRITKAVVAEFERLASPVSPCLVAFHRPRTGSHLGVYIRGKVLHITDIGVEFQPIRFAGRAFKRVRYFR